MKKLAVVFLLFVQMALYIMPVVIWNKAIALNKAKDSQQVVQRNIPVTSDGLFLSINKARIANGLSPFVRNTLLDESSKRKCDDMIAYNYYAHNNPVTQKAGGSYIIDVGQYHDGASENLNKGVFGSPDEAVDSWMNSESHRASILDPGYTEIGFATCVNQTDPRYLLIVQHKIKPPVQVPQVNVQQAPPQQSYYREPVRLKPSTTDCTYHEYEYIQSNPTISCTTY